jgi:hypothetical protein
MPGFPLLDVAIGMIFVYLLLSLICSALNEGVESVLRHRAHDLETGIRLLLNDPKKRSSSTEWLRRYFPGSKAFEEGVTKDFYEHPFIRTLYRNASRLPTYIPTRSFSMAILDLYNSGVLPPRSAEAVEKMIVAAEGDAPRIRENIENWFNGTMDRVSGWYKRRTQFILFGIAAVVTLAVNADSIQLYEKLHTSKNLDAIVAAASAANQDPAAQRSIQNAMSQLEVLDLMPRWQEADLHRGAILRHFPGWLMTIAAIMLGAPFWFDLLNRFMVVRATVKPKEKSPEEPSKA